VLGKLYLSYVIRQIDTDDMFSQVPCVMTTLFKDGGCPLTTATALADCACTNTTMQSHLSACVQRSCDFAEQIGKSSYTRHLTFETLTASRSHGIRRRPLQKLSKGVAGTRTEDHRYRYYCAIHPVSQLAPLFAVAQDSPSLVR
jgi:hypothetical protein